jgi:hypothetical protein
MEGPVFLEIKVLELRIFILHFLKHLAFMSAKFQLTFANWLGDFKYPSGRLALLAVKLNNFFWTDFDL